MWFATLHNLDSETPVAWMLIVVSIPGLSFYLLLCSWGSKWTREACLHFHVYLSAQWEQYAKLLILRIQIKEEIK